jgi:hypothetical protein
MTPLAVWARGAWSFRRMLARGEALGPFAVKLLAWSYAPWHVVSGWEGVGRP